MMDITPSAITQSLEIVSGASRSRLVVSRKTERMWVKLNDRKKARISPTSPSGEAAEAGGGGGSDEPTSWGAGGASEAPLTRDA